MKTKIQIIAIALAGLILGGCSSSLQLSKSTGQSADDVYYTPGQKAASSSDQLAENSSLKRNSNSNIDLDDLEKKYASILASDTTGKIDTVIYKAKGNENPYERVLSDSYQESYERRLRGRHSGYYGFSGAIYNYDDYWYASSYDPAFYNVIVMGSEIWVEPWHISAMFGWPGYRSYGYGYSWPYWGWGYNPWAYGYGGYWGYNSYAWGYNSGFWNGYYWGNYYGNNNYYNNNNNNNYYHGSYGSRPNTNGAVVAGSRPNATGATAGLNDRQRDLSDRQVVLTNQDPVPATQKPVREIAGSQDGIRKPAVVTRPTRESLNINPTRVVTDNRVYTRTEPTRESYNPSYTKPKPANTNEFNRPTRNYPAAETVKGGDPNRQPAAAPQRGTQPERTYSPPPRTSTPSSTPNRDAGSKNNSGSRVAPSSSGSSGSGSSTQRSSGGSSSSGSSSGSSSSSSSSSSKGSSTSGSSSTNTGRIR